MKIRFTKTIGVDVEKVRLNEIWNKTFYRWQELQVESVYPAAGGMAAVKTLEGDSFLIAKDAFEKVDVQPTLSKILDVL